jgi:type IV pilus assembly protein PilW
MNKQSGFTLIEIMIAGIIGVFIITGLFNFFIATNKSVTLSDTLAKNQEVGRFAMEYLTKFVRRAGYSEDEKKFTPPIFIAFDSTNIGPAIVCDATIPVQATACAANNVPTAVQASTTADPNSVIGDRLSIPYTVSRDDINTITCTGAAVTGTADTPTYLVDVFWVSSDNDSLRQLRCNTFNRDTNKWLSDNPAGVAFMHNIERMEFLVGINEDPDQRSATKYVNLDTITAPGAPLNVFNIRSIRIALLTTSSDELDPNALQSNNAQREYILLDADTLKFNDSSLRNIFMTTIEFPNMIESAGT